MLEAGHDLEQPDSRDPLRIFSCAFVNHLPEQDTNGETPTKGINQDRPSQPGRAATLSSCYHTSSSCRAETVSTEADKATPCGRTSLGVSCLRKQLG